MTLFGNSNKRNLTESQYHLVYTVLKGRRENQILSTFIFVTNLSALKIEVIYVSSQRIFILPNFHPNRKDFTRCDKKELIERLSLSPKNKKVRLSLDHLIRPKKLSPKTTKLSASENVFVLYYKF